MSLLKSKQKAPKIIQGGRLLNSSLPLRDIRDYPILGEFTSFNENKYRLVKMQDNLVGIYNSKTDEYVHSCENFRSAMEWIMSYADCNNMNRAKKEVNYAANTL